MNAPLSRDFARSHDGNAEGIGPAGRLWSLWDVMINFQLFALASHLKILDEWERKYKSHASLYEQQISHRVDIGAEQFVKPEIITAFQGCLHFSTRLADTLSLQGVHDRVELFNLRMKNPLIDNNDFSSEIRALKEAFYSGIQYNCLYLYPPDKAKVLMRFPSDWRDVVSAFPGAEGEAKAAVDCWALGHSTASVFHLMRVAEHGLRALAIERRISLPKGKPIEWATWQEIIKAVRAGQDEIGRTKPAGPGKDDALSFYSGALAHMDAFKDKYRNAVMHSRESYDEHQAASAMMHVREFMTGIAAKINERAKPIRWRFK